MKKTDIMTPAGFVLGAALIGYGIVSGGPFSIFIDIPSIFICVGGSLSALFMKSKRCLEVLVMHLKKVVLLKKI